MDNDDIDKVNELARSLYEKHLAVSMEEAVEKAKNIILHTDVPPVGISENYAKETEENLKKLDDELKKDYVIEADEPDTADLDLMEKKLKDLKEKE